MPYKNCPFCRQTSYSAAADSLWSCPCCGEEISRINPVGRNNAAPLRPLLRLTREQMAAESAAGENDKQPESTGEKPAEE